MYFYTNRFDCYYVLGICDGITVCYTIKRDNSAIVKKKYFKYCMINLFITS